MKNEKKNNNLGQKDFIMYFEMYSKSWGWSDGCTKLCRIKYSQESRFLLLSA